MRIALLTGLLITSLGSVRAQEHRDPDTAMVHQELAGLRSFLEERMVALDGVSSAEGHRGIARSMEGRIGAWRRMVREAWPDDDDGLSSYGLNMALASSFACSQPALSSYYQFMATQALFNQTDPHRPMPYAELGHMEELLFSLSRARDPERIQRLRAKVLSAYAAMR